MFTGLIQKTAPVRSAEQHGNELRLSVETGWDDLALGESIATNGVCLTVAEPALANGTVLFHLSSETLERTAFRRLIKAGSRVNLERSLRPADRLGGHWVQGHVDGVGTLLSAESSGDSHRLRFSAPDRLAPYLVEKGSITVDGISLTLNRVSAPRAPETFFEIMVIPHTWQETTLSDLAVGDAVNLEVDILAKYAERMLLCRTP